jgi:hypothetical protein
MIKKIYLKPDERETIINFNDEEEIANLYTCNRSMMTKMDKLCKSNPNIFQLDEYDDNSKTYLLPKKLVSIHKPKKFTAKQIEARKNNAKKLHQI